MLSKVIQSVWVAAMSMPPRRGGAAAAGAGVGAATVGAATETDAAVGAGFGTGAAGEVASGARRVQAAKPNAATDPTILQTTCRRVNASMRGPLSVLSPRHA